MFRKTILATLSVFLVFLIVGCGSSTPGETSGNPGKSAETLNNLLWLLPAGFKNVDELLSSVGMFKFGEYAEVEPEHLQLYSKTQALHGLTEFYMPGRVEHGLSLSGIDIVHSRVAEATNTVNSARLLYGVVAATNSAYFQWSPGILPENATKDFFWRGESDRYWEERNGVDYAVTEWEKRDTQEPVGYVIAWTQHRQSFLASLPAIYTLDEALAFCDAQPVEAWELFGDAVSVSVQGMSGIGIFDGGGAEIAVVGDELHRLAESGEMERIGYKWLIDEDSARYQYVLGPGEYSFAAERVKKGAGLLVKHFESGEVVSSVDYARELSGQSVKQLYLEVTSDYSDTTWADSIPASVSTR